MKRNDLWLPSLRAKLQLMARLRAWAWHGTPHHHRKPAAVVDQDGFLAWGQAQATLLDAIEMTLARGDYERAGDLVRSRFALAEECGISTVLCEPASGETH